MSTTLVAPLTLVNSRKSVSLTWYCSCLARDMVGIAALLPRMFQNTLNIITQRNRKYKLAQTAAKMIKAY